VSARKGNVSQVACGKGTQNTTGKSIEVGRFWTKQK